MLEQLASLTTLAAEDGGGFLDKVFDYSADTTVYFFMGSIGTLFFLIRLVLMLAFGVDSDMDIDADVDADIDAGGMDVHDVGFSVISLLSILSFMMSAGWMGYLCRTEWEMGPFAAGAAASGFGFAMMLLASAGMYSMKRLQQSGHYDVQTAVGSTGRVYLKIPEKGQGAGQVEITIGGRKSVRTAISSGPAIESFSSVRVIEVLGDDTLVVETV